jgi:hypothetical protein
MLGERLLAAGPTAGVDLDELEQVRRQLVAHEREHDRLGPGHLRAELELAIEADIHVLCVAYLRLQAAADAART